MAWLTEQYCRCRHSPGAHLQVGVLLISLARPASYGVRYSHRHCAVRSRNALMAPCWSKAKQPPPFGRPAGAASSRLTRAFGSHSRWGCRGVVQPLALVTQSMTQTRQRLPNRKRDEPQLLCPTAGDAPHPTGWDAAASGAPTWGNRAALGGMITSGSLALEGDHPRSKVRIPRVPQLVQTDGGLASSLWVHKSDGPRTDLRGAATAGRNHKPLWGTITPRTTLPRGRGFVQPRVETDIDPKKSSADSEGEQGRGLFPAGTINGRLHRMNAQSKSYSFQCRIQVFPEDVDAAAAYALYAGEDGKGNLMSIAPESDAEKVQSAVSKIVLDAFAAHSKEAGLRPRLGLQITLLPER